MPGRPPAVTTANPGGRSPFLLLCEHASNFIPAEYAGLGLPPAELQRHIAWDIGAAAVANRLSDRIDATLILSGYSRLLIDCNRPLLSPTSIPERSEDTVIPGNLGLAPDERQRRAEQYFWPFQTEVMAELDRRVREHVPTIVLGVHSFTPVFQGVVRPWQAGVLYADAVAFSQALIAGLARDPGLTVGDNEPYRVEAEYDHTVPVHGDARGLPAALLEIRQDLIADDAGAEDWAGRLAPVLSGLNGFAR